MPGDAVLLNVLEDFDWIVTGTDHEEELSFVANPPDDGNVNWVSLPYTIDTSAGSSELRAHDIVAMIEGGSGIGTGSSATKIFEVGMWDAATQNVVTYSYDAVAGWTGTDFLLEAGDAIFLNILQDFTWTPSLLTPPVN
jgi:hypothetical protein